MTFFCVISNRPLYSVLYFGAYQHMVYRENCEEKMNQFLKRCFYHSGQYSSEEHFLELDSKLREKEVRQTPAPYVNDKINRI